MLRIFRIGNQIGLIQFATSNQIRTFVQSPFTRNNYELQLILYAIITKWQIFFS